MLFFLFACIGNLTYVLSIFAYKPQCRTKVCDPGEAPRVYARYILVNLSWLLGSLGTLLLDLVIFVQFFKYRGAGETSGEGSTESSSVTGDDEDGSCNGDR
jgi:solute carrier family 66 (lysosomal lysine-arginine transporter), member 1